MNENILYIERDCSISLDNQHLVLKKGNEEKCISFNDVSTVVVENIKSSITISLIDSLMKNNKTLILCNEKSLPSYIVVNSLDNVYASKRIDLQVKWLEKYKNLVWLEILRNKIENQIGLLNALKINSDNLIINYELLENRKDYEGYIAKLYFKMLFGKKYNREDENNKVNNVLNYGYVVLTNAIVRSIVAHGYLPQIGIHHDSKTNSFNLACDLVEPFRPIVDFVAFNHKNKDLTSALKKEILSMFLSKVIYKEKEYSLIDLIDQYVNDVCKALENGDISCFCKIRIKTPINKCVNNSKETYI